LHPGASFPALRLEREWSKPASLLVVEDDEATRKFPTDNFGADGFRVASAASAGEGMRAIEMRSRASQAPDRTGSLVARSGCAPLVKHEG
jgi:hypothetical protein